MFSLFNVIHERDRRMDGQTDGQTPHDGIGRATHSVVRQKMGNVGPTRARPAWCYSSQYKVKVMLVFGNPCLEFELL